MKNKKLMLLLSLLLSAMTVSAQLPKGYSCDFENEEQNATWKFVGSEQIKHNWVIGDAVCNGGKKSLYISADNGASPSYTGVNGIVYAYTDVYLAVNSEKYILSFDWQALGYTPLAQEGLFVCWVPETDYEGNPIVIEAQVTTALPTFVQYYGLELNPEQNKEYLYGKSTWQSFVSTKTSSTDSRLEAYYEHYRLVIGWRSTSNGPVNPGACVDNITIVDGRACAAPSKLTITTLGGDSLILNWKGDTAVYEVGCYSYDLDTWLLDTIEASPYVYTSVPEGFCDFYVRAICHDEELGDNFYSAKVMDNKFIYYPNNHCIDYLTLTSQNCYISTQKPSYVTGNYSYKKEMVDLGTEDAGSRHTHHYSKWETDPHTRGRLKTVPEGEIASVRLGNWLNGNESERVEFNYKVNADLNPILVLKYAVVLESPGHDKDKKPGDLQLSDPRFTLRILHNGMSIGDCATADFTSSWVEEGWTRDTVNVVTDGNSRQFIGVWKDWTTVGINLRDYDGETLKIQLTTFDCSMGGHCGYAYFALGCASDKLDGMNCDGQANTEFSAPAGFKYRWYNVDDFDKTVLSEEQIFTVDSLDQNVYGVDVIFPENDSCFFSLYATSQPQYPVAGVAAHHCPRDCQNYVRLDNTSLIEHVKISKDPQTGEAVRDTARDASDNVIWDLGKWGTYTNQERSIELAVSNDGDSIPVRMQAYLGTCMDVLDTMIYVPAIGPVDSTLLVRMCPGDYVYVNKTMYSEVGEYQQDLISLVTGCDSTLYVHVEHIVPEHVGKDTIILDGDSVFFHDKWYKESVLLFDTARAVSGKLHCDSLIDSLNLYVHQNVMAYIQPYDTVCQDSSSLLIPYRIMRGRSACAYSLVWADDNILSADSLPLPENGLLPVTIAGELYPNIYEGYLTVYDSLRYLDTTKIVPYKDTIYLVVNYPSSILTQRWNDVLAVKNEANNGGYIFSDYQWYKNNMQMEGDTATYIYSESGLDMSAQYAVRLTRQSDGVVLFTCPASLTYIDPSRVENIPTLVDPNSQLPVQGKGIARWITPSGMPLSEQNYENGYLQTPSLGGLYLLQIMPEERRAETHHVIVK